MNENNLVVERLAKGASISILGKLFGRGINFAIQIFLARYLGPGLFGLYAISWALLRIIGLVAPIGLEQGVVHFGVSYKQKDFWFLKNLFSIAFIFTLLFSCSISILLFCISPFLSTEIFKKPGLDYFLKVLAFSIPFVALLRLFSTSTTISKSTLFSTLAEEISQPSFELLLILLAIFLSLGIGGILWATVLSFCLAFILSLLFIKRLFPEIFSGGFFFSFAFAKPLILFSIPIAFANLFGIILSWMDRILVGYFLVDKDAGIYASVSLVSVIFVTILSGIKVIFSPMIADFFHRNEQQEFANSFRLSTKWGLYLSLPIALFLFFNAKDLLLILFGPEYVGGSIPLIILVIGQLINIGTGPVDTVLIMTRRNNYWFWLSCFAFIFNVIIAFVLIPAYGINGAATGTSITISGMYIIGLIIIKIKLHLWPYDLRIIKSIISSLTTSGFLYIIKFGQFPIFYNLILSGVSAIFVFYGTLYLLKLDKEDKWVLKRAAIWGGSKTSYVRGKL